MRSASFDLSTVLVDDIELTLMSATLMVVRRDESTDLDWECVAISAPSAPLPQEPVHLVMHDLFTGRRFAGDAVVVRSDDQRHVFRGGGALAGIEPADGLDPTD